MNEQIAQKEKETIARGNFSSLVCEYRKMKTSWHFTV